MNPSDPPPFYQLDEYAFQELCRETFALEERIANCYVYGTRGQEQRGIDLLASPKDGGTREVGQCKCYQKFPPAEIIKASDEFLVYLEHWRSLNIERFILFVACPLTTRQQIEEIQRQEDRFNSLDIKYEAWDARILAQKLRAHPGVVWQHTHSEEWVRRITGQSVQTFTPVEVSSKPSIALDYLSSQIDLLSTEFSREIARQIDEIQEMWREGREREAQQRLLDLRQQQSWQTLEKPLRAKVLRVLACHELHLNTDLHKARELIAEAAGLDPSGDDTVARTLLRYYSEGAEIALSEITELKSVIVFNLKVALLLEAGRLDEAAATLQTPPVGITPDVETMRLQALVLLAKGDLTCAQNEIETVLTERPQWQSAQIAAAIIDYASCLSPSLLSPRVLSWPEPTNQFLIKSDDDSLQRLKRAETKFAILASRKGFRVEQRKAFETWKLACLCSDPARRNEANAYCRELMEQDPAHYRALVWAVAYNLDVDVERSEKAVENYIAKAANTDQDIGSRIEATAALLALYLKMEKAQRALDLLANIEGDFVAVGVGALWALWQVQALLAVGKADEALKTAQQITDSDRRCRLEIIARREAAYRTGDYRSFVPYLQNCLEETGESQYLLELCEIKFHLHEWHYVIEYAEALVEKINTAHVVRLTSGAMWNAGRSRSCLEHLERHISLFPEQKLPDDLWRLRVNCRLRVGTLAKAVADATALVQHHHTTDNLLILLDAHLHKGDLKALAVTARDLIRQRDVPPIQLIRIAKLLRLEDMKLAREFLLLAQEEAPDDPEILGLLVSTGFELNLEDEAGPFLKRLMEKAPSDQGNVRAMSLDQAMEAFKEQAEHRREADRLYQQGELPLHLLSERFHRLTLADLLHGLPEGSREATDLRRQPAIFARHGRQVRDDLVSTSQSWRLHLDITALILAQDLGILDLVEKIFKPLNISSSVPRALVIQLDRLMHQQPSRLGDHKIILSLLDAGKFKLIDVAAISDDDPELVSGIGKDRLALLRRAQAEGGFVVDYLPLTSNTAAQSPVTLPPEKAACFINCRAVLESLRNNSRISSASYQQALKDLDTVAATVEGVVEPPLGATLFLHGNIAGVLAGAGLLKDICHHFRTFIDPAQVEESRWEFRENDRWAELREWLRNLMDRIRDGLDAGVYETIEVPEEQLDDEGKRQRIDNFDFEGVGDLLRYLPQEGDCIWVDDRFVNRHLTRDHRVPIVGISEVLKALRQRGEITDAEYFAKLLKLRAGNIRHIPLEQEEVLYHLSQAQPNQQGGLAETPELSVLRRYLAACLIDAHRLRRPPMPPDPPDPHGEMPFVQGCVTTIADAIIAIWANCDLDLDAARARADWLLENLYTGDFGVRHLLPNQERHGEGVSLIAGDISLFLLRAIIIDTVTLEAKARERRRQFFEWLDRRMIMPRFKANPDLAVAVRHVVNAFLSSLPSRDDQDQQNEKLRRVLWQQLFLDWPEHLQESFHADPQTMEWFGIEIKDAVGIGPLSFPADAFFKAMEKVVNGGKVNIQAREPEAEFTLTCGDLTDRGDHRLEIIDSSGAVIARVTEPLWELASPERSKRKAVLRGHRHWFDCDRQTFTSQVKEISALKRASDRINRAQEWQRRSAEFYYRSLEGRFERDEAVRWAEIMPPSVAGLLQHYRLDEHSPPASPLPEILSSTAESLLADEGLEAALDRLACLPIRIPDSVATRLAQLPPEKQIELLEGCERRWGSPVCLLHLVELALRSASANGEARRIAQAALGRLFDDEQGGVQFELFSEILNFANDEFAHRIESADWHPGLKLLMVWAHASKLHNVLHRRRIMSDFKGRWHTASPETLNFDPSYWNDVLHPHRLNRTVFLTHGVAALLAGNEQRVLDELGVANYVRSRMFIEIDGKPMPAVELLRDAACARNVTGSFLGDDRSKAIGGVIGEDNAAIYASKGLREWVEQALSDLLNDPTQRYEWFKIFAVLGDLPLYPELVAQFKYLVVKTDLVSFSEVNLTNAIYTLRAIGGQLIYLNDDELEEGARNALLQIAGSEKSWKLESSEDGTDDLISPQQLAWAMVECARLLSLSPGNPQATSRDWGSLLQEMFNRRAELGADCERGLFDFLFELPASQLRGLWPALLVVRASRGIAFDRSR